MTLTQILALDGLRVKGNEEVVAGLAQLLNGDGRRAPDHAALIIVEQRPEDVRRDAVRHLVLAPFVGVRKLQSRAEHPAEHCVGPRREQQRIDDEPRVVHDQGDALGQWLYGMVAVGVMVMGSGVIGGGGGGGVGDGGGWTGHWGT